MKKCTYSLILTFFTCILFAGNFTPGNVVVVRVGDGTGTLNSAAQPVFLDEYNSTGTLVQTVALPTTASGSNHQFVLSGSATSEGELSLSGDGQYLVIGGYDAATGTAAVATDSTKNRVIALIGANGVPNTSTGIVAGAAYKKNNFRGAATQDGTGFWGAGNGSNTTGGTYYIPYGSFATAPVQVSTAVGNTRVVNVFNGQVYISSSSGAYHGVSTVGTGLPTTTGQATTVLAGVNDTTSSTYGFYFADLSSSVPGVDVLYVCDDRATASNGGLYKYSLVGGTWVSNGVIASSGLRGLAGFKACGSTSVSLVATSETTAYGLIDASGYNAALTGTLTSLKTAATNTKFRGVAFAPGTGGSSIAITSTVTNLPCAGGNNGAVDITVTGGAGGFTYAWSNQATTEDLTGLSQAGTYTVTVTDASSCSATASAIVSQAGSLAVTPTIINVLCHGGTTGTIEASVSGGTPAYAYTWTGGSTASSIGSLAAGAYNLTVTDQGGCTLISTFNITEPTAVTATTTATNATAGQSNGSVTVNANGGAAGFTYAWGNGNTTNSITGLGAGNYCVTVTDANNCSVSACGTVAQVTGINEASFTENVNIYTNANTVFVNAEFKSELNYSITLADLAGNILYTQAPVAGTSVQTQIPVANVASGYYLVRITTEQGSVNRKLAIVK